MADPTQIELETTYDDDHAGEYARRNLDREWAAYVKRQQAEGGGPEVRGAPGQGTEAPATPPTAETSKAPKSSFSAAIDATLAAAREGILTAVKPGPLSMESAREVVMGTVQTALAPLAGLAAGIGQEFENLAPETAAAEFLQGGVGGPAWTLRHIAMGAPAVNTLTPEQVAALSQPMSGREALEFAAQQVPFAVPGGKRVATAVKMQAPELRGQRGSIGPAPPPEGAGYKGQPRPTEGTPSAVTFKTAKGSEYAVQPDGTTIRNKAARPEHPGDAGPQPPSEATFYVDEAAVNALGEFQARGAAKRAIVRLPDGRWGIGYVEGANAGQVERRTVVQVEQAPRVGLYPVELWDNGTKVHFGNKITEVSHTGAPAPAAGTVPPTAPPGPAPTAGPAPAPGELTPPPGAEARINLARQAAPESAKQVMTAISKIISERPDIIASRRTVTHAETIAEAAKWKLDAVLATEPLDLPLREVRGYQHAARDYFNAASQHVDDLVQRIKAGDPEAEAQWKTAELMLGRLAALQEMPGTEVARSTEARKIPATMERVPGYTPEAIQRIAETRGNTDVPPRVAAAMYEALPTQAQRQEYARQVWEWSKRNLRDRPHSLWINALLSNPVTHSANVAGTGLAIVWNLPEHYTAEIINRLFFRDAAGVQRGETAAMLRGVVEGLKDGFRLSGKMAKRDLPEAIPGLVRRRLPQNAQEWLAREPSLSGVEESLISRNLNELRVEADLPGILRIPTMALGIEDAFAKGLVYRMELKSLALRQARAEGKIGAALEARVTELEAHPPGPMIAEAVDASMLRTLNAELGPTGQAIMTAASTVPFGRVVAPFIRTPTNGAKWWGQRAPILAQLSAQNWRDITAGGAARDKAIARQVLGGAAAAVIAAYVLDGTITGPGTKDKRFTDIEREVKPRNSICIKGECYDVSRLEPVGGLVNLVASYIEISQHIPVQDDLDEWAAYGEAVALAVGHVLVNKTSMQGFSDMLDAIEDPHRNVGKILKGWARSTVPAGVRAYTRTRDDNIIRDAQGLLDQIKSGIPYYVDDVPAHHNPITGEPVQLPPGWGPDMLSPVFVTKVDKTSPRGQVFDEILKNRIALPTVPWYVGPGERAEGPMLQDPRGGGRAIKLSAKQRQYWIWAMTQGYTDSEGRNLLTALTDLVTSEKYKNQSEGPGGGRERYIKLIYSTYMDAGKAMLQRDSPSLQPHILELEKEKLRRLLPKTDPRSPQYTRGKPLTLGR